MIELIRVITFALGVFYIMPKVLAQCPNCPNCPRRPPPNDDENLDILGCVNELSNGDSFDTDLAKYDYALVIFVDSMCHGHGMMGTDTWAGFKKAAKELKLYYQELHFIKVDCKKCEKLCEDKGVSGCSYDKKFYKKGVFVEDFKYGGGNEKVIIDYVLQKMEQDCPPP